VSKSCADDAVSAGKIARFSRKSAEKDWPDDCCLNILRGSCVSYCAWVTFVTRKLNQTMSTKRLKPTFGREFDLSGETEGFETAGLRLDFRGVPLQHVFDYISNAAGVFIHVKPNVDVWAPVDAFHADQLNRQEALELLQDVLNKNGCTAIQDGKKLTVIRSEDVKKSCIPLPAMANRNN